MTETVERTVPVQYDQLLAPIQYQLLLMPPPANRIEQIQGNDYLPHEEARAALCRIFGPGNWDSQVIDVALLYDEDFHDKDNQGKDRTRRRVAYRVGVKLRIRNLVGVEVATFVEYHVDEKLHPSRGEAHAGAVTSAASYAFRRCAIGLGDALGLSLYTGEGPIKLINGTIALDRDRERMEHALSPNGYRAATAPVSPAEAAAALAEVTGALGATEIGEENQDTGTGEPA
jgi:hypothetical protein